MSSFIEDFKFSLMLLLATLGILNQANFFVLEVETNRGKFSFC
jgi:hypothetical protein